MTAKHLKHPSTLWPLSISYGLFMYAFIAINTLLVLYTQQHLHLITSEAYKLFAAFNALIFTSPLVGGFISDKFGHKNVAFIGVFFSMIGTSLLVIPGEFYYYSGLAIFIIGYGLCTPAILCLIGANYTKTDSRRDSAFTIFYFIFNGGSLLATIASGYISALWSYKAAFITGDVALLASLFVLFLVLDRVEAHNDRNIDPQINLSILSIMLSIAGIAIAFTPALYFLLKFTALNNGLIITLSVVVTLTLIRLALKQPTRKARFKLITFIILCVFSAGFWAIYMLEPSLMTVFAANNVNRFILGFTIPPSVFYGLNSVGVIIFGIIFSYLWRSLKAHNRDLSLPTKFASSFAAMSAGFFMLVLGVMYASAIHLVSPSWIVWAYVFFTIGEMLIAPIGFSMVGRLSPQGKEGYLMGVWTLFVGLGALISGYLANFTTVKMVGVAAISNPLYLELFAGISITSILIAIIVFSLVPTIKRMIA